MKKIILVLLLCCPLLAQGHGYWFEVKGSGKVNEPVKVLLYYGEYSEQLREKGSRLDKMSEITVYVLDGEGKRTDLKMLQTDTHWESSFTPAKEGIFQILGINDIREVQDWTKHGLGIVRPIQYLRTTYTVGSKKNDIKPALNTDAIYKISGNKVEIKVTKAEKDFSKAKLTIINPAGWEKIKTADENGNVTFDAPQKGLYIVEIEWLDQTPGKYKDKDYPAIRHRLDMSLTVN